MAALKLQDWKVCESAFRRGTELQPDLPKAWKGLADVYEALSDPAKALEAYTGLHKIAESKGNGGKAGEWLVCMGVCLDRAKQTTQARETLTKALAIQELEVRVRCRGLVRLLELEERRLRLQPERRGELVDTYQSLLQAVEEANATEGEGDGEGEGEGWGSIRTEALRLIDRLPELMMDSVMEGKTASDKAARWKVAGEVGKRVGALTGALGALEVVVWGYCCAGVGGEAEALTAAKSLVTQAPGAAAGNALVGWKLLANRHLQQARGFLEKAAKGGRVPPVSLTGGGSGGGLMGGTDPRLTTTSPCPSCLALVALLELHALHSRFAGTDRATFAQLLTKAQEAIKSDEARWGLPPHWGVKAVCRQARARYLEWCGKWEEAREEYRALGGGEGRVGEARVVLAQGGEGGEVVEMWRGEEGAEALALKGWALWRVGGRERAEEARALLTRAAQGDAAQGYYLGRLHWELGEREACVTVLLRAAQADPAHAPTYTLLGHWYRGSGSEEDLSKALRCYRRAVELEPLEAEAGNALSTLLLATGPQGEEEASKVWHLCTVANVTAGWAWRWTGWRHLGRKEAQEAVTCFQYAVRSSDDDAAAWIGLGRAYHSLQMEAAALRAMDKAVELRGGKGRGEVGLMQLASGLVEEAAVSLQVAREEGGEGDVILAKALAEAALIQACSRMAEGYRGRALAALDLGIQTASSTLQQLSTESLDCSLASVYKLLGDLETMKGLMAVEGQGGAAAYDKARREGEGKEGLAMAYVDVGVEAYVRSRVVREEQGEGAPQAKDLLDQAAQAYRRALELDLLCCPAWSGLGVVDPRVLVRQHCLIRAIQLEADVSAWANLGVLYASSGRKELAREAYRGLQLVQDHPVMWLGLGLLHEEDKDYTTARDAYRAALEVGAHPSAQLGVVMCNASMGPSGDLHEALVHALMLIGQRPSHALGLNMAGLLLLDLTGRAEASEHLLSQAWALQPQLCPAAQQAVYHNLCRARAAQGLPLPPEDQARMQGFLAAKSLCVRGDWAGLSSLCLHSLSTPDLHPTLATRWTALAALCAWQTRDLDSARQHLAALLPLEQGQWPPKLHLSLCSLSRLLHQPLAPPSPLPSTSPVAFALTSPDPCLLLPSLPPSPASLSALSSSLLLSPSPQAYTQAMAAYNCALPLRPAGAGVEEETIADWAAPAAAAWGAQILGLEAAPAWEGEGGKRQLLKAIHMYPHLQQPWRALAHGLVMWEGRATQAAEILTGVGRGEDEETVKVLRGEEGQGQGTLNRARAKAARGEWPAALVLYKQAVTEAPEGLEGWREMAMVYFHMGKDKAACRCVEAALSLPSLSADTRCALHCLLAQHHYSRGHRDEAMAAVGEACKARPTAAVPLLLRGLIWRLEGAGREKQAQDNFNKALELQPHNHHIRRLVGVPVGETEVSA